MTYARPFGHWPLRKLAVAIAEVIKWSSATRRPRPAIFARNCFGEREELFVRKRNCLCFC